MVLVQAQGLITLHMPLHFRVTELIKCGLFVNRSLHQALGFRSYMCVAYLVPICGRVERLGCTKLQ